MSIEIFAGQAIITLGLMFSMVPCLRPWDLQFGSCYNVLENGWILFKLISDGYIGFCHLAVPCQSNTWARDPPLRSWQFIFGLPDLNAHQRGLVEMGNSLAAFAANLVAGIWLLFHNREPP